MIFPFFLQVRIIDDKTLQCAMRTYERAGKYVPRKNTYVLARRDFNAWLEDDPLQTFNSFKYHLVRQYYDSLKFTVIRPFLVKFYQRRFILVLP